MEPGILFKTILFLSALSGLESHSFKMRELSQSIVYAGEFQFFLGTLGADLDPESAWRLKGFHQRHIDFISHAAVRNIDWKTLPWADGSDTWRDNSEFMSHDLEEARKKGISSKGDEPNVRDRYQVYRYATKLHIERMVNLGCSYEFIENELRKMRLKEEEYVKNSREN